MNDSGKLLTFVLQLHIAIFDLQMHTTVNIKDTKRLLGTRF